MRRAGDRTLRATVEEGQVTVFVAVNHTATERAGFHAAKKAARFAALASMSLAK